MFISFTVDLKMVGGKTNRIQLIISNMIFLIMNFYLAKKNLNVLD